MIQEIPAKEQTRDLTKKELSEIPKFYSKNFLLNKRSLDTGVLKDKKWKDSHTLYTIVRQGKFSILVSRDSILLKEQLDLWCKLSKSGTPPDFRINTKVTHLNQVTTDFNYILITDSIEGGYFVRHLSGESLLKLTNILSLYEQRLQKERS